MKRSKFSEEQIVYAIRQAESGTPVGDVCRQLGVAEQTILMDWTHPCNFGMVVVMCVHHFSEEGNHEHDDAGDRYRKERLSCARA